MAWFGVGSGSRRAKPQRAHRFVEADRVVIEAFADLHEARHLKSKFPSISPGACNSSSVRLGIRLIDYLIKLPNEGPTVSGPFLWASFGLAGKRAG
jgi:hypothetical protein